MPRVVLAIAWGVVALVLAPAPLAEAASPPRNVLVIYSNGRLLPANIEGDRGLRETVLTSAEAPVLVFDEFLDLPRFSGDAYVATFARYLREKYATRPPAVIVAAGDDALAFLLENRAEIFPAAPVVHMAVFRSFVRAHAPVPADVVGVPIDPDFAATIAQALRWHPEARRLVLVTGASVRDRAYEALLRDDARRAAGAVEIEHLAGLSSDAVLARLRALDGRSVVFTPGYFEDGEGRHFTPRESVAAMAAVAGAPIYGPFLTFLGAGVVGGYMPDFVAIGRQAGISVNELLAGVAPASLRMPERMPAQLNVDWRQVQRWRLDERAIPSGAVVHFREPSFVAAHRGALMIAAAVFLLQAGLIAGLLFERRQRRLAEQSVERQRVELAHASRLAIAGELTGSIAHEINQPLGAILSNADAAELLLESGGERRGELREILAAIRRDDLRASEVIRRLRSLLAKHEVERQPFLVDEAIDELEPMLRAEAQRRRVALDLRSATPGVTLVGDRVQLQQVVLNLVLNAMEAVADEPADRRTVVVSVESTAKGIAIVVHDRGHGIAPENVSKLFDPFFSTKREGMGIGLSIARTLVEAHGGRIWAENGAEEGAVFHVELPVEGGTDLPRSRAA